MKGKRTTAADLARHDMLAGLDRAGLLEAMRIAAPGLMVSDETLAAMANAVLVEMRHQGYAHVWCGAVPDGAMLASADDR